MDTKDKTINVTEHPARHHVQQLTATGASKDQRSLRHGYRRQGRQHRADEQRNPRRLMGFRPDKYVIVNFDGIAAIVDAIGGVDL